MSSAPPKTHHTPTRFAGRAGSAIPVAATQSPPKTRMSTMPTPSPRSSCSRRALLLVPQQQLPPLVVRVVVVREDERADPLEEDDDEDRGEEQKDEEVHQALGRRRAPRHAPDQPAREVQVRLDVLAPLDRILELPALPVQLAEDPVPEPLRVRRDALRRLELSEAALGAVGRGAEEVLA